MPQQHVQEQVELIARHEQEFFANRTPSERAGDFISSFAGSLRFVAVHLVIFAVWIGVNTLGPQHWRFDPYPFSMLNTLVAMEALLLASFILMRQARSGRRADEREHLMLQLLLLTEKETTAVLQVNLEIAEKLGLKSLAHDRGKNALSEDTPVEEVAESIKENIASEG
jgi:uncharacterized membrane protein